MAAILVPFRGAEGKRRLAPAEPETRIALALAMLADVLSACIAVAPTTLAGGDEAAAAVAAEIGVGTMTGLPPGGLALAPAADGTTNALALAEPRLFRPLYGPGSAERFLALPVPAVTVDHPNLADDVDTLDDLHRLELRAGPRTQMALAMAGLARVA